MAKILAPTLAALAVLGIGGWAAATANKVRAVGPRAPDSLQLSAAPGS